MMLISDRSEQTRLKIRNIRDSKVNINHYDYIKNRASKYLSLIYPEISELRIELRNSPKSESYVTIKGSKAKMVIGREADIDIIFNHEIGHIIFYLISVRPDRELKNTIDRFYGLIKHYGLIGLISEGNYLPYGLLGHPQDSPSEMFASLYNLLMLINSDLITDIQKRFIATNIHLLSKEFLELNLILSRIYYYMPELKQ